MMDQNDNLSVEDIIKSITRKRFHDIWEASKADNVAELDDDEDQKLAQIMLQHQEWEDVEKFMHPAFQSVHQDGARNKEEEIKLLKGLKIKDINLGNFKVTQDESLLIVTYTATAKEIIDGESTLADPAQRLTVFIKSDGGWKWLAHANFIAIKSKAK